MLNISIEEMAYSWAKMEGKGELFIACKTYPEIEDIFGHYEGYITDVETLIEGSPLLQLALELLEFECQQALGITSIP